MKHLTRKLTSMVLAVIMVLALCPAVFAATVATVEYDKVLFSEDFDGDTELNHELVARAEENVLNNRVENGVMVLSKNATSGGNYFRMRYNNTKYNDVDCLDEIYAEHPERLSQVRATMDFYFVDSITPFNIAAYDSITNTEEGKSSKTNNELALINTNGEVKVGGKVIAAVVADTWYTVEIILDFNTDKFSLKISDETGEIGASAPRKTGDLDECINSFGISVGNMKDVSYTMYFDNMKFEVPSENVEKYTSKLLNLDFEEANDIADCSIEDGLTVTTINEEGRGMVAQMVPDGNYRMFTVTDAMTQGYYTYDKYGKYPEIIKAEVDLFKTNYAGAYICFDGTYICFWSNTNEIMGYEESTAVGTGISESKGNWITITLYMNFKTRKYDIYVDGEKAGDTYNIPSAITSPEKMGIRVHKSQTGLYVDNMSISAAAPYESNEICAYLDENGILGYGYVLNNADAENAISYDIYAAKFDSTGTLVSTTKTPDSVAAGTMELKNIEVSYADDGGFYRYFMFENGTLRPLN